MIEKVYDVLYSTFGPQHWWPAETPFEVVIGAILTQNTAWKNVERAIENLKKADALTPDKILKLPCDQLQELIRPAGFFKQKCERLKSVAAVDWDAVRSMPLKEAREFLLSIKGVGKETADSILLYALNKPIFVVDAYTKRIYSRLTGEVIDDYDQLRRIFESELGADVQKLNEMHALLVELAKRHCTKRNPKCEDCPLKKVCVYGSNQS